jgi:hypothetical protein
MVMTEITAIISMRLTTFGYSAAEADQSALDYVAEHAAQYVCNYCHFRRCPDDIPNSLRYVVADYAIGEFLQYKKTFAPSDLANLNLSYAVKQIQTGDTTTVFATGDGSQTDEQRLDSFITYLMTYGKSEMYSVRRPLW